MPFQPGCAKSPDAGMKPGQKSAKTQAWERIGEYLINEGADRYKKILKAMSDEDFAQEFRFIMEYFKPKLSRSYTDISINQTWDDVNTVFEGKPKSDAVES